MGATVLQQSSYHVLAPGGYKHHNDAELVAGGREYFERLIQLIQQARHTIHLQVYIYDDDETGQQVAAALTDAVHRGVQVFLLVDGYASQKLPDDFIRQLKDSGIFFHRFEPLFKSSKFYLGRRLHHKILVVDSIYALVGGINISNRYNDFGGVPSWFDMAVYVKGETVPELEYVCCKMWNSVSGLPKAIPQLLPDDTFGKEHLTSVRVRRNDWVKTVSQVWYSYAQLFAGAREEIIIASSYFLPGWKFRKMLAKAVQRGVSVRVIVAGFSDVMIAKHAERYLYRWLLGKGIHVYEYQKTVLHAKVALADGKRMTIGSYNVNNISAYASIELNLDIRNRPFVSKVKERLDTLIEKDCQEVTWDNYHTSHNWLKRLWQRVCFEMVKVLLYLFTFYFRQQRDY